ncbi:MAG: PEP-CTERM sorting domain-containing protein [Propionivibrio sp.]|uniref:laminin B domain-containing protein n=1 Tax=Propionivibrio sp. TaxID=2212460 RepID=UPI001A59D90C|nr:laminin B domain-containing protein [Propionivibrio sp.]MBL8415966.1 PEP-CTERM sorting domain-containing protein [Propionivibrio sp.]
MKSIRTIAAAYALAVAGAVLAAPAPVLSNFSLDSEGWITVDLFGLTGPGTVTWDTAGFIASYDTHKWNAFSAPAKFLGDKGGFLGGTLSLKLSDSMSDAQPNWPVVVITDGAIKLASWPFASPGSDFTDFSFALDAGSWVKVDSTHPSASEFAKVLGGLTGVFVNADFKTSGNDYARLDDVVLTAPVPEPETYALFLAGLGVLGVSLGRRRRGA